MAKVWTKTLAVSTLLTGSLVFYFLFPDFVSEFQNWMDSNRELAIASLGLIFLFFCLIQLLVLPSGTAMLLISGALLGPMSGVIYFAAMLGVTPILYAFARTKPNVAQQTLANWTQTSRLGSFFPSLLRGLQTKPILGVGALRLLPILPSAPAVLVSAALGLSLRAIIIGTALFGGFRPILISMIGFYISGLSRNGSIVHEGGTVWLLSVSVATLISSLGLLGYLFRTHRAAGTMEESAASLPRE